MTASDVKTTFNSYYFKGQKQAEKSLQPPRRAYSPMSSSDVARKANGTGKTFHRVEPGTYENRLKGKVSQEANARA